MEVVASACAPVVEPDAAGQRFRSTAPKGAGGTDWGHRSWQATRIPPGPRRLAPISAGWPTAGLVIEAIPKEVLLYGKIELWVDAETWDGTWNRKFSWQGELVHGYQTMARVNQPAGPPGPDQEYVFASKQVWACAENFKMNRATLGGMRPNPKAPFVRRAPIDTNVFDAQALSRYGK